MDFGPGLAYKVSNGDSRNIVKPSKGNLVDQTWSKIQGAPQICSGTLETIVYGTRLEIYGDSTNIVKPPIETIVDGTRPKI